MILSREIEIALPEFQRNAGTTSGPRVFVYQGKSIPCIPSNARRDVVMQHGGDLAQVAITLAFRDSDLNRVVLAHGKIGVYCGKSYRIIAITSQNTSGTTSVDLCDPSESK